MFAVVIRLTRGINIHMRGSPHHRIELKTTDRLPKGAAGLWARTVIKHGPRGTAVAAEILRGRELVSTRLYCIRGSSGYHYIVPLSRDLSDGEAEAIVKAWSDAYPDGDFVVNWSQPAQASLRSEKLLKSMSDQMAEAAAKISHNRWYQRTVGEGWQWGPRMSVRNRMHPMLRPWDDLPQKYRSRERDRFVTLLDVLEGMGLRISRD
jgi:hypothetical protein